MRIDRIRIENFRVFEDETITFGAYNCFAGPNGAGKSTILTALNVFFRGNADSATNLVKLDEEDFHQKRTSRPIRITVTFRDLSDDAKHELSDYVRQDTLVVSAVAEWNQATRTAEVKQVGSRLGMAEFAEWFRQNNDNAKVAQLQDVYAQIRTVVPDLPSSAKTKPAMLDALGSYERDHPERHVLLESADQWYGVSRGKDKLSRFVQWVYVPAVKDANNEVIESKKTALGALLERTVRANVSFDEPLEQIRQQAATEYGALLEQHASVLKGLSRSLTNRLREWAHPDAELLVKWRHDPVQSVELTNPVAEILAAEGPFTGKLARFGHGLQRSFLLAILQELGATASTSEPTLLLAIEEPELYQHPPQARHLAGVLNRLSSSTDTQVIVCTHSPLFIAGRGVEDIRLVRKAPNGDKATVSSVSMTDVATDMAAVTGERPEPRGGALVKIHQVLQPGINEMFFTPVVVMVEGLEDHAYITAYLELLDLSDEFRRLGCHIVPMPTSGKSYLIQPLAIARRLAIPTFVVFDSDTHNLENLERSGNKPKHAKDNAAILRLCGVADPEPFPPEHYWGKNVTVWSNEIGAVVAADYGEGWNALLDRVRQQNDCVGVGGLNKNSMFIGYALATAWDEGKRFPTLDKLCRSILDFAREVRDGETRLHGEGYLSPQGVGVEAETEVARVLD